MFFENQILDEEHEAEMKLSKNEFFLQDVKFDQFAINYIEFINDATSLFITSLNNKHCFSYDLTEGKVVQIFLPKSNDFLHVN